MSITEVNNYLFSEELMTRFKNNLEILLSYGIVGYCEIESIRYYEILEEIKKITEWYMNEASKEDVVNWTFFFDAITGIKDRNKFIEAIQIYDMNMEWKVI